MNNLKSEILKDDYLDLPPDPSGRGIAFKPRVITAKNFDINQHEDILNEPENSFFILCQLGESDVYVKEKNGWRKLDRSSAYDFLHQRI